MTNRDGKCRPCLLFWGLCSVKPGKSLFWDYVFRQNQAFFCASFKNAKNVVQICLKEAFDTTHHKMGIYQVTKT